MAPPGVQGGNEQGDPPAVDEVQNHLVGVETSHRRRRCYVLIVVVVLCVFIIGGGASVPFVLTMISQSGFNKSTQLRTTSEPTVNSSEPAPTVIVTSYSWSEWSPWSSCSITPCDVEVSRRESVCTMKKGVVQEPRAADCVIGLSSEETRKCPFTAYCRDCAEIKSRFTESSNGTYRIDPDGRGPFYVYCDMTTDGGGWTVFQRRQDGSEDFNRTWYEYKTGFGNLSGEFWLGNDKIHRLTYNRNKTLRMDMVRSFTHYRQELYDDFNISSEYEDYTFYVGDHIRGSSSSLLWLENGQRFSTLDRDHDGRWQNIAAEIGGGWWYRYDYYSQSPNGLYGTSKFGWYYGYYSGLTYCDMKVK